MPYTVITHESLLWKAQKSLYAINQDRSISTAEALIGSHLNKITKNNLGGLYWFSRLMEYRNIRLVIGGHKHTYTCTWPIMENYWWTETSSNDEEVTKYSLTDDYDMPESLKDDNINFVISKPQFDEMIAKYKQYLKYSFH